MKNLNMKNIFMKFVGALVIMFAVVTLVACGNHPSKELWDNYVKAVNNKDINAVAECFTEPNTPARESFATDHADYFDGISKIKTVKYNETINCDFSNSLNNQAYYLAEIEVLVNGTTTYNIKIYSYLNNKGLFFCSYFKIEDNFTENAPNDYWKDKAYFHTDDYLYKKLGDGTVYVEETSNLKKAVVPAEIDGSKVTTIGEYAFYQYTKMLSFTIPTSRLRELEIEEGIQTIGKYAFYQCNKLKELVIPESVRYIDRMAFANCSRLERLEFQTRTKEVGSRLEIESISYGEHNGKELVISGAHNLLTGEIIYLSAELGDNKVPRVEWSSSSEVLSINSSTGKVTANKSGRAKIIATLVENRAVTAEVEIVINDVEASDCLKMYWDVFSRCGSLKEIYIHAYNPNSFIIDSGSGWVFNSTCKIYVPKGSRDMYVSHTLWSKYADQIVEMQEDDAEIGLNVALECLNLNASNAGDIYSAVNPNKIDNIIYLIQNGSNYDLVNAYVGSKIYNNASASIIASSTDKNQLYELFSGLIGELSKTISNEDINIKVLENEAIKALQKLDKIYEDYKASDYSEESFAKLENIKLKAIDAIKNASSKEEMNTKLLTAWKDSYAILKTSETEKPEKDFDLDAIAIDEEDIEDVKHYNKATEIVFNKLKESNATLTIDKLAFTEINVVENELNPGVTIYRVSFKNTAEGNEENVMNVYIKNNTNTIIDNTYDGIYDLIKIVMASASKVEK